MRSQELNCQTGHEDKSDNNKNSSGADLDFLSRERKLLGDNAAEFATPNDTMASATVDDGIDDFFIGGGNQQSSSPGKESFAFESSFPSIDAVRKSPRWRFEFMALYPTRFPNFENAGATWEYYYISPRNYFSNCPFTIIPQ